MGLCVFPISSLRCSLWVSSCCGLPFLSFIDFFFMCMSVLAYIPVCMCTTWLPSYPQRPKEEVRCPWIRVYGWLTAGYWGQNPGPLQITAHTFKPWANSLASPFFFFFLMNWGWRDTSVVKSSCSYKELTWQLTTFCDSSSWGSSVF